MRREILNRLSTIEREFDVRIIFASESGSRAWGFASEDSDFDVRFVYCHPRDWYLSVTPGRDVIELDMTDDPVLDIRGWDVRKALGLVANSNMSPYEWLGSPISYRCDDALCSILTSVMPEHFSAARAARHYLSMAKSNIAQLTGDYVRLKTYLYATRLLLCCRWVVEDSAPPPVLFHRLVERFLEGTETANAVSDVIREKATTRESDAVRRLTILDRFIHDEYARLHGSLPDEAKSPRSGHQLDQAFRSILDAANANR